MSLLASLKVLPQVLLIVIGIAADQARGDDYIIIMQVLHCFFGIIGHLALAQKFQVPLVDALHAQKDAVKARLTHLVHQLLAGSYARGGGLRLVAQMSEPGIDDGLA